MKPRELDPTMHGTLLGILEQDLSDWEVQRSNLGSIDWLEAAIHRREQALEILDHSTGTRVLVVDADAAEGIRKLVELAGAYDWVQIAKDAVDGRQAWREAITSVASALLKFEIAPSMRSRLCYADFGVGLHCTLADGHAGDHGQGPPHALDRSEVGHGA